MAGYECPDCGGLLEYNEDDDEFGEHHECIECGKIILYK